MLYNNMHHIFSCAKGTEINTSYQNQIKGDNYGRHG